ncbi:MAG: imidazole glycerol phosphate synthase subunit HisH [Geminocystis sp.]|nr:imidazole glycerol phosphate synthase subunit HisH [Geminocystis sp.]
MTVVAIVDYDMGNLHSVAKGIEKAGAPPLIPHPPKDIPAADAVILPGVGSFDPAMLHLQERDLIPPILDFVKSGKPFLGICLGMQILFDSSEEGKERGLGIIPGTVKRFQSEPGLTIPHMGWNTIELTQSHHPLWHNLPSSFYVYFVHSYFVFPLNPQVVAARVTHGTQTVTAAIAHENIMAVQFHPEKSADLGLQILGNFVKLAGK